ncbi:CoA transferase [Candidimonas humi]|uniref:CaiB/BaiF CoA transferase family protein n=1 Tax=Candidimonas humi TaxID=683355 RepID=A0ABV8P379_9BURK|nr:CoA transferase [Candidimonas humi]MBV6306657.1 CoA transferase [Candidimonas humi]
MKSNSDVSGAQEQAGPGPLGGVRVVDLSRLVAGNQLTMLLADFGAEVIKIEQPGQGDPLRHWRTGGEPLHWEVYGRNKKSVALDLKSAEGRESLLRLVAGADVLVESFRPGTLEKLNLAPAELHKHNSRLLIVRISGWGQTGEFAGRPGFGTLVEAMSGFAAMNGFEDREPVLPPNSLADMVAGTYGAFAVAAALRQSEGRDGSGQVMDLSLFEPLFSILGPLAAAYEATGEIKQRAGSRSQTAAPRNVYKTKDGKWLALSSSTQAMTERLLRTIGHPDLIDDPRFASNSVRLQHADELDVVLNGYFSARTADEILDVMGAAGVTMAPVMAIDELLQSALFRSRDVVVKGPARKDGTSVLMHNVVPRLSRTPGTLRTPAPELGEHNRQYLD